MPAAIAAVLIAGVGIGVSVGLLTRGSPSASTSGTSPGSTTNGVAAAQARALYQQALAAMRGSAGFHYVADSGGVGPAQTIVGDAGRSGGRQDITIDATAGREQFTLILAGGIVYFQGNVGALEDQLGVPAASAPGLQGKWVSVSNQDGPYIVVAPGITIASQVGRRRSPRPRRRRSEPAGAGRRGSAAASPRRRRVLREGRDTSTSRPAPISPSLVCLDAVPQRGNGDDHDQLQPLGHGVSAGGTRRSGRLVDPGRLRATGWLRQWRGQPVTLPDRAALGSFYPLVSTPLPVWHRAPQLIQLIERPWQ